MPDKDLLDFLKWFRDNEQATFEQMQAASTFKPSRDQLQGYADVFSRLGLLDILDNGHLVRVTDAAHAPAFFRAMADLVERDKHVLGSPTPDAGTWLQVLYAIESRRREIVQDDIEEWRLKGADIGQALGDRVRKQSAAELVLVGTWEGHNYLLLEFDVDHWHRYRLVGGKREANDKGDRRESAVETMRRELREELDRRFDEVFTLPAAPSSHASLLDVSRRLGELTYYTFHVFTPVACTGRSLRYDGTRKHCLWWLRVEDVLAAVDRRDDLIFHQLVGDSVVRMILASPPSYYQLSATDASRIIDCPADALMVRHA